MLPFRLILLAALALPGPALASDATIVKRDVPLRGERALAAGTPERFNLVGLHWRGSGSVEFRTRSLAGRWSAWRPAAPEAEDMPDSGTAERARSGSWRLGNPWWTGSANRIEYRLRGKVTGLRAWFVWSPEVRVPTRATAVAGSPALVPRSGWKADEAIKRAPPTYATQLRLALVHHTAGANAYGPAEAAAAVRAIQLYHVKGNGWNDIGYNFLVDKYGEVYEGRFGGADRNVVGAHAEGFNTGSVGVAVLGEYGGTAVSVKAAEALAAVLAWRLDAAHLDPLSTLSFVSGGNQRFPRGIPVFLRAVSGHRDTGFTECPGTAFYSRLGELSGRAQAIGLPKLYAPAVTGGPGGLVRFRAKLSSPRPWSVTVTDTLGFQLATQTGFSATVDWAWDATFVPPGAYTWEIATDGATSATGTFGGSLAVPAPLALKGVAADPETLTPNADGVADESTLTYTLTAPAAVTISATDLVGAPVATLFSGRKPVGEHVFRFAALDLADGRYQLRIDARGDDGIIVTALAQVLVSRTLGFVEASPAAFSPNADGRADTIRFKFLLDAPARVKVRVLRDGRWVATPFDAQLGVGLQNIPWSGTKRLGRLLDGEYVAVVEATDALGMSSVTLPFLSDTRAPKLRILRGLPLKVWVSEPASLTLRVNGRSLKQDVLAAGEVALAGAERGGRVRVVAWDAAGNPSLPAKRP